MAKTPQPRPQLGLQLPPITFTTVRLVVEAKPITEPDSLRPAAADDTDSAHVRTHMHVTRWGHQLKASLSRRAAAPSAVTSTSVRAKILRPAGATGLAILHFGYSRRTCERYFEQIVADMREEINADLAEGRPWRAKWSWARGHAALLLSAISHPCAYIAKKLSAFWKPIG